MENKEMNQTVTLDDIINDLKGFGLKETEDVITLNVGTDKTVRLRISNLPTEEELAALAASEEYKGHMWIQRVRAELLSRAISWINGQKIEGTEYVAHPLKEGISVNIRVALRDILMTWGVESISILWKILMVHNQKIEDSLIESFPDTVIMTNFEQRFLKQAMQELEEVNKDIVASVVAEAENKEFGEV